MKKKFFSILLCITMLTCSAAGCKSDDKSSDDSKAEQSQSVEYETMNPPEDGWTIEEILNVTYLCDKQLSYPIIVSSLADGLELDMENIFYGINSCSTYLYYNGEYLGECHFTENAEIPEQIVFINVDNHNSELTENIVVNGIGIGDTETAMYNSFGTPDDTHKIPTLKTVRYYDKNDRKNGCLIFTIDTADDTITAITISLKKDLS